MRVRTRLIRQRLQQLRTNPPSTSTILTPRKLKTSRMLVMEYEYDKDIAEILTSMPARHWNKGKKDTAPASYNCGKCVSCVYGISEETAYAWMKRLGLRGIKNKTGFKEALRRAGGAIREVTAASKLGDDKAVRRWLGEAGIYIAEMTSYMKERKQEEWNQKRIEEARSEPEAELD